METWIPSYNTVLTWIVAWLLSASTVESSVRFNHNAFSVYGANTWSNLKWTVSKHKVTTVLTHYSHRYLRRNTVTHTSVFWRNLLPPSSLLSGDGGCGFLQKKVTPPQPRKLSCEYVNTHATRTDCLTWPLLWDGKYFSITVHVWCKHASPIGLNVGLTEPSALWVLEIKGLEWEADWRPPTIPNVPHIFMAWYFNQQRDNFTVT